MRIGFVALFLICASASIARAEKSEVLMRGMGLADCVEYVAGSESEGYVTAGIQWVYGHWSGLNRYLTMFGQPMKDLQDRTVEPEPLAAQILAICKGEPDLTLVVVADRIFERLPDIKMGNLP